MWGFIIALISGALMSVQGIFNTKVTESSSLWVANSFVQLTALIVCLCAWFVTGRESVTAVFNVEHKYMLLGGVLGAGITWSVIKSMDKLGTAQAVLIIVISQITVAYIIELFGIFGVEKAGFQWTKLIGVIIAVIGIFIFKR